jgi:hypothetical protein
MPGVLKEEERDGSCARVSSAALAVLNSAPQAALPLPSSFFTTFISLVTEYIAAWACRYLSESMNRLLTGTGERRRAE